DYNRRSIAETAMYRVKQLFGGSLTLRDYDGQVAEAMVLVRALNKMTKAGMPEGTVAKLAMRQPFVLFKGLTFQKLCLPGAFRPGDHHN
ncbi:hypothetical protein R7K22_27935, partial [Klebsiella pneumoniae]|nr:hypothetical protein [Klebsiella pneumoniae]